MQFFTKGNLVQIKEAPPYTPELEHDVLLNPAARAVRDDKLGSYSFPKKLQTVPTTRKDSRNAAIARKLVGAATAGISLSSLGAGAGAGAVFGVGTDVELISSVPVDNATFVERNFTEGEINYCRKAADPKASFAARWSAKEATVSHTRVYR